MCELENVWCLPNAPRGVADTPFKGMGDLQDSISSSVGETVSKVAETLKSMTVDGWKRKPRT